MDINSYEDVQEYIRQLKQSQNTEEITVENQIENKTEIEIENKEEIQRENKIENENEIQNETTNEIEKEKELELETIITKLLSDELKSIISIWKSESKTLTELFLEEYQMEYQQFEEKWKSMKEEEQQSIMIMAMDDLHENEKGEMMFVENVFPDLFYLLDHPSQLPEFIQKLSSNQRFAYTELFDVDKLREMIENIVNKADSLFCVTALLFARMCIALKFCLNVMIFTIAITVE